MAVSVAIELYWTCGLENQPGHFGLSACDVEFTGKQE
jgi:hypothetical protein